MKTIYRVISTIIFGLTALGLPTAAQAHYRHRNPHHNNGGDDDFVMGAFFGALTATTLLDFDNHYDIEVALDKSDEAAFFLGSGVKTPEFESFLDGFRSQRRDDISDREIAINVMESVAKLLAE